MAILPFLTKLVKGDCPTELNIYILLGYFKDNIIYAVVTAMVTLCTWNITKYIPGSGFLHLIIKALACVIIPNILFILLYARTNNFKMAKKWIKNKLK